MEHRTSKDDESEEEISDSFLCCVCLELLYKPIVLSCGHLSCFWCVHKSMNGLRESHCPICRDPYLHFPSVCQKLHFLLKKLYPLSYRTREEQVLKEESEQDCFSPQIDAVIDDLKDAARSGCNGTSINISGGGTVSNTLEILLLVVKFKNFLFFSNVLVPAYNTTHLEEQKEEEECPSTTKSLSTSLDKGDSPCITNDGEPKAAENADEDNLSRTEKDSKQISKDDLLCLACKKLLIRPVVLNCGHVYCEACITNPTEENEKIRCQECQALDPRGFPKVCLVLEQFLEETFTDEYTSRRSDTKRKQDQNGTRRNSQTHHKGGLSLPSTNDLLWWAQPGSNVHIGAGCDSCGIYPIVGDRYRCKDCKEEMGYDLCSDCYNTRSKLPGRFNQQHTPEHRLERVDVPQRRLLTRLLGDGTNSIVFLPGAPAGDDESVSGPGSGDDDSAENQNDNEESSNQNYSRSSSV